MTNQPSSESRIVVDSVNDNRHPFGLPPGSVRGMFSLLICGFFWMVMLWPSQEGMPPIKAVLGHFFLLALVLMAFVSHPHGPTEKRPFLPWVLRIIFVGGSVAITAFAWFKDPNLLRTRLTPDAAEFAEWWMPYLISMATGFGFGLVLRFVLGRNSQVFMTIRSWLSVVGMILLCIEYALFLGYASAENKPVDFFRYWQVAELVIVSAYFGTRA
jgi:glucan phosphoethanolaminetransferase (alkaline phosphatase superfamily)